MGKAGGEWQPGAAFQRARGNLSCRRLHSLDIDSRGIKRVVVERHRATGEHDPGTRADLGSTSNWRIAPDRCAL